MIIFVKIYCYWTRTVGVIAKGSRGPVFFETQCRINSEWLLNDFKRIFDETVQDDWVSNGLQNGHQPHRKFMFNSSAKIEVQYIASMLLGVKKFELHMSFAIWPSFDLQIQDGMLTKSRQLVTMWILPAMAKVHTLSLISLTIFNLLKRWRKSEMNLRFPWSQKCTKWSNYHTRIYGNRGIEKLKAVTSSVKNVQGGKKFSYRQIKFP